jgi:hypothetical protein
MTRGWLWVYWRSSDPAKALVHAQLLRASVRSWRAHNPGTDAAVLDCHGELSPEDRVYLGQYVRILLHPGPWFRFDVDKLVALTQPEWEWTVISDLDILWTGPTEKIWAVGAYPDATGQIVPHLSGIGYRQGHAACPCDCVLVCRSAAAAAAALEYRGHYLTAERPLRLAAEARALTFAPLPEIYAWRATGLFAKPATVHHRSGLWWALDDDGAWQRLIGLHFHGSLQARALTHSSVQAYLASLP